MGLAQASIQPQHRVLDGLQQVLTFCSQMVGRMLGGLEFSGLLLVLAGSPSLGGLLLCKAVTAPGTGDIHCEGGPAVPHFSPTEGLSQSFTLGTCHLLRVAPTLYQVSQGHLSVHLVINLGKIKTSYCSQSN